MTLVRNKIYLNQLEDPHFKIDQLNQDFDLYAVHCTRKYISRSLLNRNQEKLPVIKAVNYIRENNKDIIYILTDKGKTNIFELKRGLTELDETIGKIEQRDFAQVETNIILNLLLIQLQVFSTVKGCNLLGKLYVNTNTEENEKLKFEEVSFSKNLVINIQTRAFTQLSYYQKKQAQELIKNIKSWGRSPRYEINLQESTIKQMANCYHDGEENDWYLMHPTHKNLKPDQTPFFYLNGKVGQARTSFLTSKSGIMYYLIDQLNKHYSQYFDKLKFREIQTESYDQGVNQKKGGEKLLEKIKSFWSDKEITLIDRTQENLSAVKTISDFFSQNLSIKIKPSQTSSHYNLALIHNLGYYSKKDSQDKEDTYYVNQAKIIQNITIEGVLHKSGTVIDSALINAVKELTVKAILEMQDFSPLNTGLDLDSLAFYKYYPKSNQTLEFTSHETNFQIKVITSNFKDPFFLNDLFIERNDQLTTAYDYIILDKQNENYYAVSKTSLKTIPSPSLYEAANNQKGTLAYRNKEARNKYLAGLINLNYFYAQNQLYYNVGVIGNGMQSKESVASVVRKIECLNDNNKSQLLDMQQLLQSMDVVWVKFKNLTVLPFPIKLMNEYIRKDKNNNEER